MTQWILKANGKVLPCRTWRHLTPAELAPSNKTEVCKQAKVDACIMQELGDLFKLPPETLVKPKYASVVPRMVILILSHTKMISNPLHMFHLLI